MGAGACLTYPLARAALTGPAGLCRFATYWYLRPLAPQLMPQVLLAWYNPADTLPDRLARVQALGRAFGMDQDFLEQVRGCWTSGHGPMYRLAALGPPKNARERVGNTAQGLGRAVGVDQGFLEQARAPFIR